MQLMFIPRKLLRWRLFAVLMVILKMRVSRNNTAE